jgi:glutamine cyclotransferase
MKQIFGVIVGLLVIGAGCACISVHEESDAVTFYTYRIINVYPHDVNAFTQGLVFEDGFLYEGTGLCGRSSVRKVDLETGNIVQIHELPRQYFGEGITIYEDRIIQLTWQSHTGFVYDRETFELLQEFAYPTEGWGITDDKTQLIMSDGTSVLHFLDPETFEEIGSVDVVDGNIRVTRLNELEYINGKVYANVWQTDRIVIIQPNTGRVTGWINLGGLLNPAERTQNTDVLNGIAYDEDDGRLFVTGKLWPHLFEIELVPAENTHVSCDSSIDINILKDGIKWWEYAAGDGESTTEDGKLNVSKRKREKEMEKKLYTIIYEEYLPVILSAQACPIYIGVS